MGDVRYKPVDCELLLIAAGGLLDAVTNAVQTTANPLDMSDHSKLQVQDFRGLATLRPSRFRFVDSLYATKTSGFHADPPETSLRYS